MVIMLLKSVDAYAMLFVKNTNKWIPIFGLQREVRQIEIRLFDFSWSN